MTLLTLDHLFFLQSSHTMTLSVPVTSFDYTKGILFPDGFTTRDLIYSWNDEFVSYVRDKESAQFSVESFHYLNGTRTYATGETN